MADARILCLLFGLMAIDHEPLKLSHVKYI